MFDFYTRFYQAVASSAANAEYCATSTAATCASTGSPTWTISTT